MFSLQGCTSNQTPAPLLHEVDPATVWDQIQTPATLHGDHLYRAMASVDLGEPGVNTEQGSFEVSLDGTALAPETFQWVDARTLQLVIPPGLPLGSHSISVRVHDGRTATLENAFTVGVDPVPYCGDGSCNGNEEGIDCPEDCAAATCGDGSCNGDEDYEDCPEDCEDADCGDGACNGTEDASSCPEDCGSCDTCTTGSCSETCTDSCDFPRCDGPCLCNYDCTAATGNCGVECRSACTANCEAGVDCNLECRDAATCKFNCTDSTNCDTLCRHDSTCTIDCTGGGCGNIDCHNNAICTITCADGADCGAIMCSDMSECLVDCTGANNCAFALCEAGELSCPGDVIVCGRPCP